MIRSAYYEHPDYVPLLRRSFQLWRELQAETSTEILHMTGGIYMGRPEGEMIAGSLRSCREHGLPHELYSRDELRRRFPQFHVPDDFVGLHEHEAGFLVPELAVSAHAHLAMRHGAILRGNEPVQSWTTDQHGATVVTTKGTYHAEGIVFSGGAWTAKLLRDLKIDLCVARQVMGWVQPLRREPFLLGTLPVWAIGNDDGSLPYGFPITPQSPGFKIAHHAPGTSDDPDTIDRNPRDGDEATFRGAIERFIPDANGPLQSIRICMYTNSPDHHFIIDQHPDHPRVTIAAGFSGHGFKFATVIGEALADLAMHGRSDLPIEFLSARRFAR